MQPLSDPTAGLDTDKSAPAPNVAENLLSSSILEAIPDAVVAVNQQGEIVQVNSQTLAMFGYSREELIGQWVEMLVPDRVRSRHHYIASALVRKPRFGPWVPVWT